MSAELAARRTAAAAVLADYTADAETTDMAGRALWAARLADMLASVLGALQGQDDAPAGAAERLEEIRAVFEAFDWSVDDRQFALEEIEAIVKGNDR